MSYKGEYNGCSYATLFKDKKCPNLTCCQGKGLDGCYECEKLEECEVGFYHKKADAISAKANALLKSMVKSTL